MCGDIQAVPRFQSAFGSDGRSGQPKMFDILSLNLLLILAAAARVILRCILHVLSPLGLDPPGDISCRPGHDEEII